MASATDRRRWSRTWPSGRHAAQFYLERLECRIALSQLGAAPDLQARQFDTVSRLDWGDQFRAVGTIDNIGGQTVETDFLVDLYVSSEPTITQTAVRIGTIPITEDLNPGQSVRFDQVVRLPAGPIPGIVSDSQPVYLSLVVDAGQAVAEFSETNNAGRGLGDDQAIVTIGPEAQAQLVPQQFQVMQGTSSWGQSLDVEARVGNTALADAPATQARIVLTPEGRPTGQAWDLTIGRITVPIVPAEQSIAVQAQIDLPTSQPPLHAGASSYLVSLVLDADYQTGIAYPRSVEGGLGVAQDQVQVLNGPQTVPVTATPELSIAQVGVPQVPVTWGDPIQVSATVHNTGQADAGPVRVRFLLIDQGAPQVGAFFLGDTMLPDLQAGFGRTVTQTITLPTRLPGGILPGSGTGQIIALVDPENQHSEANEGDNARGSAPVALRVFGDTTPAPTPDPEPTPTPQPNTPGNAPHSNPMVRLRQERAQLFAQQQQQRRERMAQLRLVRGEPTPQVRWERPLPFGGQAVPPFLRLVAPPLGSNIG